MLFTYDGKEYGPLLKTPRAFVVYARGGPTRKDSPTPASRFDHQKGYIEFWLKFSRRSRRSIPCGGRHDVGREREGGKEHRAWSEEAKKLAADF